MPERVQLSRAKGWRIPPGTVKVDRSTKWGNPFIVGRHGTQAECVDLFNKLAHGYICISKGTDLATTQSNFLKTLVEDLAELRGKNLACWCKLGAPCHADVLLKIANS